MSQVPVRVAVPPTAGYVRIVRVVASASAAKAGLDINKLDDLALAIDEACGALLEVDGTTSLECTVDSGAGGIEVLIVGNNSQQPSWPPAGWLDSLAGIVLESITSHVEPYTHAGAPAIRFAIAA